MSGLTQWNVFGVCAMSMTPSETDTRHMKKLHDEPFDGHVILFGADLSNKPITLQAPSWDTSVWH